MCRSLDCEMVKLILKQASVKHYDKTFIHTMTSDDKGKTIYCCKSVCVCVCV